MNRLRSLLLPLVLALALAAVGLGPATAQAKFGFLPGNSGFNVSAHAAVIKAPETIEEQEEEEAEKEPTYLPEGSAPLSTLAGSHPYSMAVESNFNQVGQSPDGDLRNLTIDLPPGLIENPTAVTRCNLVDFTTPRNSLNEHLSGENCPLATQVGTITLHTFRGGVAATRTFGVFGLPSPIHALSAIGFAPYGKPIIASSRLRDVNQGYATSLTMSNFPRELGVTGFRMVIWGNPWNRSHTGERGNCLNEVNPSAPWPAVCDVTASHAPEAYLTLPSNCSEAPTFQVTATSWQQASPATASYSSAPLQDCGGLTFNPVPRGTLSTNRTTSPSGYDFTLDGNSQALAEPNQRVGSQAKKAVVTLPEGMSVNPSVGSGLGTCSEAQFEAETLESLPGAGCPNSSKIGELTVETPLLEGPSVDRAGTVEGSMFFATPRENRFGTLLALYLVARLPDRGVLVKVAGRVDSDPLTGRLTTTFDNLPQLPYSHFDVHFREGQRSPLATPPVCGAYATEVDTSPWLSPDSVLHQASPFSLNAGVGGGACPGPVAPFSPAATAGSLNSNASSYTPFYLHLTRNDADQEITSYSATLPPGLLGKIAGIPFCPESLIEAAKRQSGADSASRPACPAASQIGTTYTGYGVGSTLAYAPGTLYLAGPYHGQPLSVVAIDSAKVGPFDLGTVVIRSAIRVNRQSAQVAIDSSGSDPIPHILSGFPLRLRDIRVYIDRPRFMVNPTDCDPFTVTSTLTGAGVRFGDSGDDQPASAASPYQVSNCTALGFAPRFSLSLKGGHRRGDYPALKAVVNGREGDANIGGATVTLPPKLFLAQEHLDTVCTPRQFSAHACPKGSVYGSATAVSPLLDEPLTGPVYLRSNGNERSLPDLVAAISGRGVEIDVLGKIDSYKGGLRARFDVLPDAPVTKFTMSLKGGDHGIVVNATNTCANPQVATAKFTGQDNALENLRVPIAVGCKKPKRH